MRASPLQCRRCRRFLEPYGDAIHRCRGLCNGCHYALSPDERLDYEATQVSRDDVLDDWAILRMEGHTKRQAADRLGMTFEAFERAFHRAQADGDPRALPALESPSRRRKVVHA